VKPRNRAGLDGSSNTTESWFLLANSASASSMAGRWQGHRPPIPSTPGEVWESILSFRSLIRAQQLVSRAIFCSAACVGILVLAGSGVAVGSPAPPFDQQDVLQFLNKVTGWYQYQSTVRPNSLTPGDVAFMNESQPVADQVVHLSFDFARAGAQLFHGDSNLTSSDSRLQALAQTAAKLQAASNQARADLKSLQQRLNSTAKSRQSPLEAQIAQLKSESASLDARLETVQSILGFAAGSSDPVGLTSHIEAVERSMPATSATATGLHAAGIESQNHAPGVLGIWNALRETIRLSDDLRTINSKILQTDNLALVVNQLQIPLQDRLKALAQQSDVIVSRKGSAVPAVADQEKINLDALTEQFRLLAAAAVPLSKEGIVLGIYRKNLLNWYGVTRSEYSASTRSLAVRLIGLVALIAITLGVFELWRRAIVQYISDFRRRSQFLLLRKIALWIVILLVTAFSFASEIGSLATFAGLLTAGIAVALQNVILAVVGYFMLIGKFGIGVGDRVQVADVTGKVVEIGLMRLHVLELTGVGTDAQPTGRMVAFSNSIAFQTAAGLFKQVPGTNFLWRESNFTLAADSDYRVVEQRLLAAIDAVFRDFKANFEQLGHQMEEKLSSITVGPLTPRLRFRLTTAGLEVILRFPVERRLAEEMEDRLTREILKAVETEPKIRIVAADVPGIQLAMDISRGSTTA
jgi:small-conductance mechanosensitive channel